MAALKLKMESGWMNIISHIFCKVDPFHSLLTLFFNDTFTKFFSELHRACMHYVIFPVCSYALASRCNIRPYGHREPTETKSRLENLRIEASRRGECAITYTTFWVIQCGINDNLTIFDLLFSIFRSIFSIRPLQKDLEVCYDMKWHCEICFSFVRSVYVLQTKLFLF